MSESQHFIVRDKLIRQNVVDLARTLTSDPLMEVIVRPYKKSKSHEQLKYLFGVVLKTIQKHVQDATGDYYTTDELYAWYIDELGEDSVVTVNGKPKVVKLTASKMNTAEMSSFMTKIIQMAADDLNCVIPWPMVGMNEKQETAP